MSQSSELEIYEQLHGFILKSEHILEYKYYGCTMQANSFATSCSVKICEN